MTENEIKMMIEEQNTNDGNTVLAAVGDCVRFTYKGGRKVWGEVLFINRNAVVLKLKSDYIGKNVEWFAGEKKDFNIKECKNFRLANCS